MIVYIDTQPNNKNLYCWWIKNPGDQPSTAIGYANSPFEAYKAAMFEINKRKDNHINKTKIKYCKDCAYAEWQDENIGFCTLEHDQKIIRKEDVCD